MSELKECPWCNETPQLTHKFHALDDSLMWRVECLTSDCEINPSTAFHDSSEDATAMWNTRNHTRAIEKIEALAEHNYGRENGWVRVSEVKAILKGE